MISTPSLGQALGLAPQPGIQPRPLYVTPAVTTRVVQDQRTVRGHTVQVVAVQGGHQILVDGLVLAVDRDDDRVVIRSTHEGGGRTYVLIEEQSGGNACPALYQAIDLSGGAPLVSPQFGNCSDVPTVGVVAGALRMAVPAFRAAPATVYRFRDGHLSR